MSDKKQADELAALKARVAELERAKPRPAPSDAELGAWRDQMRAHAERRASVMAPEIVRDWTVLDDNLVRGVANRDNRAPQGPSSQGVIPSSQQLTNVHPGGCPPGGGTGWQNEVPFVRDDFPRHPTPGVATLDRLMDQDDARDRRARVMEEARRQVLLKAAAQKS